MMSAAKFFNEFKLLLSKSLEKHGLVRRGDVFSLKRNDSLVIFEIQKDLKRGTSQQVRFTVNVGISLDMLRNLENDLSANGVPTAECHWRSRLGRLMEVPGDVWWTIDDGRGAAALSNEIAAIIIDIALPKLEPLTKAETLLQLWRDGIGQGLTEYERRVSLARLLIVLNRRDEAHEAVDALEAASAGKGWEASAKVDIRELRSHLD